MKHSKLDRFLSVVEQHSQPGEDQVLDPEVASRIKVMAGFSLLLPTSLGGEPIALPEYIDLVKKISELDGSTGWCINQGSVLASLARCLSPTAAASIWTDNTITLSNGPPIEATSEEKSDHFVLTGSWNFSSGIDHADWLIGVANTLLADGSRAACWHLLPKASAIIDQEWDVAGLRKTGSFRFSVNNLKVPHEHVLRYEITAADEPLYQIPLNLLFAAGFCAVALGVSRAAIDYAIRRAHTKVRRFEKHTMDHDKATMDVIGRAEALWQASDSHLEITVQRTWEKVNAIGFCGDEEKYALRLATTHGIRQCRVATDMVYDLCSTDSIFKNKPIQRYFQDMHVISQHLQARPEIYGLVGSYLAGMPEKSFLVD
jgi:alkylation response protein AidB-like acyl-CoA dehydrogenase